MTTMENVSSGPGGQHQDATGAAAANNPSTTAAEEQSTTPAACTETPQKQQGDQQKAREEDDEDSDFDELDGMYTTAITWRMYSNLPRQRSWMTSPNPKLNPHPLRLRPR